MSERTPVALTHADAAGRVRMVDVSDKPITSRVAVARGFVRVSAAARRLMRAGALKKGDPLQAARLAGIMAAKQTATIVPLCHPLALSGVRVDVEPARGGIAIEATVRTTGQTGVEMEALTAVAVAGLTVYDMLKAADSAMVIERIRLVEKRGGTSGDVTSTSGADRTPARRRRNGGIRHAR
ncbi:MAG: cyclic pyranopterin monophosphate synthase MoaC [Acidobacteria bacterium]|nr:cyclic pyranopterin monophosphate synthase MoaC [Acidobacteriota bacterium]